TATFADHAVFSENTAANGGAILNEGEASFSAWADFSGNTASGAAGAIYNSGTTSFEADATFSNNSAVAGGAILNEGNVSFAGPTDFSENTADTAGGGAIYNTNVLTFADGAVFKDNATTGDGGAIYNDAAANQGTIVSEGDIRFNGGASFTGNKADGLGGAVYNLYDVTLNPGMGQEILFRGNTDSTGANAIHMAAGSHLDVTGAGTVKFDDPLSFADASPTVNKSGEGDLLFNAAMDGFLGTFEQEDGVTKVTSDWNIKNAVTLSGGTLELPSFSFADPDADGHVTGGLLTIAGGTLVTATGQIFETALNAEGDNEDVGGVKADVDAHMDFDSGLIAFNDAKYNLKYAGSAAAALGVSPGQEPGQTAEKEITFTGELYTPPLNPVMNFAMLQKAVREDGLNEIIFGDDIVLESRLQGSTPIERELSIDGRGHTLSGAHPAFWFADMSTGTISIVNITFDGLKSDKNDKYDQPVPFAPAVYFNMGDWKSEAVLRIGDGVTFKNNESVPDSAGGAVRTAQGIVAIGDDVTFQNNTSGAGGGLYSESFTTIGDRVVFEGNQARRGGALDVIDDYEGYAGDPDYLNGTRKVKYVHIGKDAVFKDNKAIFDFGGNGGAIEVQSGELSIDDGAVFTGNTSNNTGGAISICNWSPQLPGKVELGQVSFIKNQATYGGAIINEGSLSLKGMASFESNSAASGGGGLYNSGTA
ncbi:pectate lyase-like adhesive domain-containing protein, partial [uncultured Bilophila sp.]|uniref:pectate lyase-like adhesive domain-containing protein n=1 Tax=uncultured Bilophila sp. TaxID=529385 RepID=UPI0026060692